MRFTGYEIAWNVGGERRAMRREGLEGFDDAELALRIEFDGELFRAAATPRVPLRIERFRVLLHHDFVRGERCLLNGWQSWTATDWLAPGTRQWGLERVPKWLVRRYVLDGSGDYRFHANDARPGHFHGWSWAEVRSLRGSSVAASEGVLLASTDESHGFTLIEMDTQAGTVTLETEPPARELAPGASLALGGYALLQGPRDASYDRWLGLAGVHARQAAPLTGYSSWYRHYGDIDGAKLLHDLAGTRQALSGVDLGGCLPLFQVDDGWCKVGDWLEPSSVRFLHGMAAIAQSISTSRQQEGHFLPIFSTSAEKSTSETGENAPETPKTARNSQKSPSGAFDFPQNRKKWAESTFTAVADRHEAPLVPGLWLAPFVCEHDSRLWHQHPSWLLRDELGRPVRTGSHWSGAFALDTLNPQVRAYVHEVIRTVTREWGFRFLKLDFLYAACMLPHGGMNRGELMADAIDLLRCAAGEDVLLDGCGVPLASAFGMLDYCRIGCDVGLDWDGAAPLRLLDRERVSTRNSLACTQSRAPLDGRAFGCDPDVFFLRDDVRLSPGQKGALLDADSRFGSLLLTSDDMGTWSPEQRAAYQQAVTRLSQRKATR